MAIQKFTPQNSDQFLGKDQGDHLLGKFGHLNYLLRLINAATLNFSPGSVLFSNSLGAPTADPTQLHWDDANNRLGIGNAAPTQTLDVTGSILSSGTITGLNLKYKNELITSDAINVTRYVTKYVPFTGSNSSHFAIKDSAGNTKIGIQESTGYVGVGYSFSDATITNAPTLQFSVNGRTWMQYPVTNVGTTILMLDDMNTTAAPYRGLFYARSRFMLAGEQSLFICGGIATSLNNLIVQSYGYAGSGSTSNFYNLQFYGNGQAFRYYATGNIVIGSTLSDNGQRLQVQGTAGVNVSSVAASAQLQVDSTTKGFLPPRMTGAQSEAIASPAEGLMVYSTDGSGVTITSKGWWGYDGATWVKLN